ncbi:hypothetical protein O6H91_02G006700 [Diphasiastrum complanatum]|uniref:Uncharacterized protein n=1 Tax=Diphasiastrum complanatum TaxID=34168 RepID=A0ACC2ECN2_DIPCM|nr:hypothetical protein O6H91_02G006700 [Diphasiastrum complanatum]
MAWMMSISLQAGGLILITILLIRLMKNHLGGGRRRLPPGPINLPVIGAFLSVGFRKRHLAFFKLAKHYGPVVYMKLGGADVVAVNSAETAMEVLRIHDAEFSGRPEHMAGEHIGYRYLGLDLCPYNAHFRKVRKVINSELLCQPKLNEMAYIRREEVLSLVATVAANCRGGAPFHVRSPIDDTITNVIGRMMFGRLHSASRKLVEAVRDLKTVRRDTVEVEKQLNIADMFPQLARFDLQRIEANTMKIVKRFGLIYEIVVQEHKINPATENDRKDFIDFLLEYNEGGDTFSENAIKAILNDMLFGGIDTLAMSVEWPLAELLRHPQKLVRAQQEIDGIVGKDRPLEESDLDHLPYLHAIVKESWRLYPIIYLTPPHVNEREAELFGYKIPAHSNVYINLYGVAHDPSYWQNADEFQPERFLGSDVNMSGTHFQLIPFSSGRRRCPAVLFSSLQVPYILAVLLHAFDWTLPATMSPKDIVMEGRHGAANDKLQPLIICAKSRLPAQTYNL